MFLKRLPKCSVLNFLTFKLPLSFHSFINFLVKQLEIIFFLPITKMPFLLFFYCVSPQRRAMFQRKVLTLACFSGFLRFTLLLFLKCLWKKYLILSSTDCMNLTSLFLFLARLFKLAASTAHSRLSNALKTKLDYIN